MRANRLYGSEGGGADIRSPYPYQHKIPHLGVSVFFASWRLRVTLKLFRVHGRHTDTTDSARTTRRGPKGFKEILSGLT